MNFSRYPVLKILFPYVFGVILGYFLPIKELNLLNCIFGIFTFSIFFILFRYLFILFIQKRYFFLQNAIAGLLLFIFCLAGYLSISFHFHKNFDLVNAEKITQKQTWIAEIKELPREREKSFKVVAKLHALNDTTSWITKKVILYFQKDSIIKNCCVGDKLIVNTKLSFIESPKNPNQFDYKKFTKRKGIYLTGYANFHSWEKIEDIKKSSIKRYASYLQRFFSNKLIESGLSPAEFSVAAAILLGNDETLEPELRASYAATGVSHILCVSGMHVGVIFMILGFLLKPLDGTVRTRFIKNVLLLIAVWLYANITGLAPSVTRAATMFSFVIIGKFLHRKTNVFHSLFASLFMLLSIKPLLLFEMGFQLSYLAVFGIVLFQNKITKWYKPKTKVVKYFWELSAVSLVAQAATAPIATYYFGQFPNYFLLTNLFVIPMSFVMTVTGVATLAFSFSDFLSKGIGFLLNLELKIMNTIVLYVEKLPGALITNISINYIQVLMLYVFFITFLVFKKNKKKQLFLCLLTLLNIFLMIHTVDIIQCKHNQGVVIYDIPRCTAFQFCHQGEGIIVSDSISHILDKRYQYNIQNHDRVKRIKNTFVKPDEDFENSFLCKKGNIILFRDTIYVLEKNKLKPNTVDLVVYHNYFSDGGIHKLE
jgi:competence protein ComEC